VVGVSIDTTHTLAVADDGSVYVFGEGFELGLDLEGEGEEVVGRTLAPHRIPNLKCLVPQ
jgi:alpha-tubulin suppressor-like RCC1 family protein